MKFPNFFKAASLLALLLAAGCATYSPKYVSVQRDLEYGHPDGIPLRLDIYTPKNATNRLPVLIWIHGGAWKSGSKDRCPIAFLAKNGSAIVSIQYRLSDEADFPAQLYDCKGAVRWLRAHAKELNLDPDRIGVLGASAGGHLAALLGTTSDVPELEGDVGGNLEQSSRVQAVCAFYPPTDLNQLVTDPKWRVSPKSDVARLLGGPLVQNLDKAARANPITYVSPNDTPFFILHGGSDTLVPPEQSIILDAALKKAGVESTLVIVPGKGHGIGAPPEIAKQIVDFFARNLKLRPAK